jgi:hypothetical protein
MRGKRHDEDHVPQSLAQNHVIGSRARPASAVGSENSNCLNSRRFDASADLLAGDNELTRCQEFWILLGSC